MLAPNSTGSLTGSQGFPLSPFPSSCVPAILVLSGTAQLECEGHTPFLSNIDEHVVPEAAHETGATKRSQEPHS